MNWSVSPYYYQIDYCERVNTIYKKQMWDKIIMIILYDYYL